LANLNDFQRLNHRMHNKVMIVDERAAIVGGRNLADEYFVGVLPKDGSQALREGVADRGVDRYLHPFIL
jgi:phosphatidylserine/phosphatidylglycerophosphate/cardiolipin synthase-like enzyme